MVKTNDVFAGIAAGSISGRKDKLKETKPHPLPETYFVESKESFLPIPEKSYDEKLVDFKKGIDDLKNEYSSFLIRYCSDFNDRRSRKYLKEFCFRFLHENDEKVVTIPHYTGPAGRWTAVYSTDFAFNEVEPGKKVFIVCKGVDYSAEIFLNGKYVGGHEGFFAAFEFDVTSQLEKKNHIDVYVENDIPTIGNGDMQVNGDKLYAATGLGWDGPEDGWHHCPAGGGIFDSIYLETRPESFIDDIFIRPDIIEKTAHITVSYFSNAKENTITNLKISIQSYNFEGCGFAEEKTFPCGHGLNYFNLDIKMSGFRIWEPSAPYMYLVTVSTEEDRMEQTFGMRSFHMNEDSNPKGDLFLNGKPILLRGANEMGHLQLCVMRDDYDQLIEDILIAKYCNMNYYRITQRPVQEEIYHYCDMLGMLCQTDLPLFGYMRKNKFMEGVKQAGEMERHVRNHPSVIMSTYINEPFAPDKYGLGHRHLSRKELELFFDACDAATLLENPDRVIKRVEGDYDPPTEKGLSDFHCYNMWYTNHALPIGMLYKGYLPALNKGWKTGCGEYGTEGLDNYNVMQKYYPCEWLPEKDNEKWLPDKIVKSQTNTMHGDWYEEQDNIKDWIEKSQQHQAFATELMTLSFRRRSDMIVSTAIHLLIDAWPSGWMKTLLDVDRVPKQAYFAFRESLMPLKVNLRCDRWSTYEGESLPVEAWILNDTDSEFKDIKMIATLSIAGKPIRDYMIDCPGAKECTSFDAGIINVHMPNVIKRQIVDIDIGLFIDGELKSSDRLSIKVFPKEKAAAVFCIGTDALELVKKSPVLEPGSLKESDFVIVSSTGEYADISKLISKEKKILFLKPEDGTKTYEVNGNVYIYRHIFDPDEVGEDGDIKGLSFVALSDSMKKHFNEDDCSYWYNCEKGFIDHVAELYIDAKYEKLFAFGYEKPSFGKRTEGRKKRLPVAMKDGNMVFTSFETKGRAGVNPVLDNIIKLLLIGQDI